MSDEHSNASVIKKIDDKLQMVQGNNSISNSCDKEFNIDVADCLNNTSNEKCDPVMDSEINLKQNGPFTCDTCGKIFKYKSHFIIHHRIHTNSKPYICSICSKGFYCQGELNKHLAVHSTERPYVCDVCMSSYKTKRGLDDHSKRHAGVKNYKCNLCEKKFVFKNNLVAHQVVHSDSKPHVCEICCVRFKTKNFLKLHKMKHSGNVQKKFKCEFCNKYFKHKRGKFIHLRLHTGEKPYMCDLCGSSFAWLWKLKSHKVRHTKVVNNKQNCSSYNKPLRGAAAINRNFAKCTRHISDCEDPKMTIPEKRPYKCVNCNKTYKTIWALKGHTKSHSNPKSSSYIYAVHENINLT